MFSNVQFPQDISSGCIYLVYTCIKMVIPLLPHLSPHKFKEDKWI